MFIPLDGHQTEPQLSIELMRELCLTLNDLTSWMEAATKEAHSTFTQAADNIACCIVPP